MTKVELEKISDADIHLFIERGMRGGICFVSKRYSKANHEFCPDYDESKEKVYIKYLGMNNVYGKAMSEYLPYGGFKWVNVNKKTMNRVLNKSDNSLNGFFLEVDLKCRIKVKEKMLAPIQTEMKNNHDIKVGEINKLIPNLLPKKNYIVHYRNLKYYLSKGWILTKANRILESKQGPWMKRYIDFNTKRRKEATNEADKNLFKLFNNAVYGKTMENMTKRMKIRVIITEKEFLKYASRPTYINRNIYGKNVLQFIRKKEVLKLNKALHVACAILELSKLAIHEFYYDFVMEKCENFNLLYMDTDSFIIEVIRENFDDIMLENKEYFDLSNFPKN